MICKRVNLEFKACLTQTKLQLPGRTGRLMGGLRLFAWKISVPDVCTKTERGWVTGNFYSVISTDEFELLYTVWSFVMVRKPVTSARGMNALLANGLLTLILAVVTMRGTTVLGFSGPTLVMDQDIPSRTCKYSRAYSMIQVRCANLGLEWIPSNLKTEIQIMDASVNRVRVLTNDSLAAYTNLAYLYLGDNFIQEIQEGAFDNLRYLKVIDLSTNGCDTLPKSLFQLPYLQKVYLSKNRLGDDLFKDVQVRSPLIFLQLSKNKLGKIPQLGPVPTLMHLNVSDNNIGSVTTEDLAPYCSLKILDLSKNPIKFDASSCECETLNAWLRLREIRARPVYNCTEEQERGGCASSPEFSNRTMELYDRCLEILRLQAETEEARKTWILIACCISGFLACLFVGLFCVHKRNKRRKKKLKEQQRLNANNANTELLNSNLNQPENT
ncbi:Tsukushin [Melipona quadrifasciata]|uniref:Tsukushin n=1 Tax=Melipona quadrifasciata TaxID=166423 RepID=A0A0M9A9P2_9HYME|nr:Tsukushin [Melipona quadrifasciata]